MLLLKTLATGNNIHCCTSALHPFHFVFMSHVKAAFLNLKIYSVETHQGLNNATSRDISTPKQQQTAAYTTVQMSLGG